MGSATLPIFKSLSTQFTISTNAGYSALSNKDEAECEHSTEMLLSSGLSSVKMDRGKVENSSVVREIKI